MFHSLKNAVLALAITAVPAFGAVTCKPTILADGWHAGRVAEGQVCSITQVNNGVYGIDPLRSLQTVTSSAQNAATEACKKLGLEQAAFITNFSSNSFQVESVGVVNTAFGSTATVTGRFACVPKGNASSYSIVH